MGEQWGELKRLFHDASGRPRSEWPAVIASTRARDPDLGKQLQQLLDAHAAANSFLESPPAGLDTLERGGQRRPRLSAGARLGPYEVIGLLGAGGMGEVYRAHDKRLNRDVALKILLEDFAQDATRHRRMQQEARAVGMLNHPNTLTVYDVGVHDGSPFFVSELLEGETLRAVLDRRRSDVPGGLPLPEACRVMREIADGLAAAHGSGIVHRDLKPENVFVTRGGRVKILDFGLARLTPATAGHDLPTVSGDDLHTKTGTVLGTVGYMAPEQIRGQRAGPPADIFAAGTIWYELLSGRHPFEGTTGPDTTALILTGDPTPLLSVCPAAPAAAVAIVERCLAMAPEARYQSGAELAEALSTAFTATESPPVLIRRPSRRTLIGAAVVGLATLALLTGLVFWRDNRTSPPPAAGHRPSLVLLPTRVFGAPDAAFLTDAVPAGLSTYLAQIEGLITNVPPTEDDIARVNGDLNRVADAYEATTCVLTTITAQGSALMLAVQLVEPQTRRVLWSRQYEGRRDSYLQMLQTAAHGVERELLPGSVSRMAAAGPANNEAELAFQTGDYQSRRYTTTPDPTAFDAAKRAYERVMALDPTRADAPASLSFLYSNRYQAGQVDQSTAARESGRWAQRAVEVDGKSALAWSALVGASIFEAQPDSSRVLTYALRSAMYGPRCGSCQATLFSSLATSAFTLSLAAMDVAHRLEPLEPIAGANRALTLMQAGRSAEALSTIGEARALEPDHLWVILAESIILSDAGRIAPAQHLLSVLERATREKRLEPSLYEMARTATAVAARNGSAHRDVRAVVAVVADRTRNHWYRLMHQVFVAPFLVRSGDHSEAFELLEAGAAHGVVVPFDWLMLDPRLAPLRVDPRFLPLARTAKVRFDATRAVLIEAATRGELPSYLSGPLRDLEGLDAHLASLVRQHGARD